MTFAFQHPTLTYYAFSLLSNLFYADRLLIQPGRRTKSLYQTSGIRPIGYYKKRNFEISERSSSQLSTIATFTRLLFKDSQFERVTPNFFQSKITDLRTIKFHLLLYFETVYCHHYRQNSFNRASHDFEPLKLKLIQRFTNFISFTRPPIMHCIYCKTID